MVLFFESLIKCVSDACKNMLKVEIHEYVIDFMKCYYYYYYYTIDVIKLRFSSRQTFDCKCFVMQFNVFLQKSCRDGQLQKFKLKNKKVALKGIAMSCNYMSLSCLETYY